MTKEITFRELSEKLHKGFNPVIFDVRNEDDAKKSNVTDYFDSLRYMNVPYFYMLEESTSDDYEQVLRDYINKHFSEKLKKDQPIVVVCAKEGTSAMIAKAFSETGYDALSINGGMTAWGKYYETRDVVNEPDLKILQVVRLARGCLGYICISGNEAIVIDPSHHLDTYEEILKKDSIKLKAVFDTHVHADHISGGKELADKWNVPYLMHPYDGIHPIDMLPATFDYEYLKDQFKVKFGNAEIDSLHIPGHTLGNMAFMINGKYLFTGDSIFVNSIARPDLGGKGETWAPIHYESLKRLLALDDTTLILPAHFSKAEEVNQHGVFAATLGELKKTNEDLILTMKATDPGQFTEFILSSLPDFPSEYVEIKRVNLGLVNLGEEEVYELEVGKNLCALAHEKEH